MDASERIVITGIGLVSGLGIGKNEVWNNLVQNASGVQIKNEWKLEGLGPQYFGKSSFVFKEHFQKLSLPFPLRYSQLAMLGCKLALEDADIVKDALPPERVGLIVNASFGANAAVETYMLKLVQKGPARVSPVIFTKTVTNCALGDVTRYFNLKGPSSMLVGENSVNYGYDLLQDNKADVMVCGGFDDVTELIIKTYADGNLLIGAEESSDLGDKLLDEEERNKLVLGEGASYVVLEKLDHAIQRGAAIYAEVVGQATGCDTKCNHLVFDRDADDLQSVMDSALKDAGVKPAEVGLVVGASCLPWQMKEYEMEAIKGLWNGSGVHYTSIKGKTGESFGASALASLATAALSLKHNTVPGLGFP